MKTGGGETRHQRAWKGTHHAQRRVQRGHVLKLHNLYKDDADKCPNCTKFRNSIADPDPNPDPDPLVKVMDPDPALDPDTDPSVIMQK